MRKRTQVVIIGGGFGGLQAARALRNAPVSVTLVDRENHHLFQPLLYQVATAGLSPGEIATPIRSVFRRESHIRTLLGEVVGVDADGRCVLLENGERLPYDYLIVAAGAKTNYFGHDEWAEHAYGLKTVRDALRLRERILMMFEAAEREPDPERRKALLQFVVIGGGPTGVELAGAISELGRRTLAADFRSLEPRDVRVVLLEMADRVLGAFDEKLSDAAQRQLEELKVEVRTGAEVTEVSQRGVRVDGELLGASVVCWAPGVRPVSLADKLGFELDGRGRIAVGAHCSVPGRPEVFAVGDIASFVPDGEDAPLPQLAPVAIQQGRHVAATILDDLQGRPRRGFGYVDKGVMATVGRSRAVAQSGRLKLSGFWAWVTWLFVHIAYLIRWQNRLRVLLEWFWAYVTFRPGARLIVARYELPPPDRRPHLDPYSVRLPGVVVGGEPAPTAPSSPAKREQTAQ